ncbi:carbon-nitrogen hydrolase family protein [Thalassotalea litorea]|uniref:Carbon-nitrogen hydrolase family protein n=2 Tax=Thalassotalea litorea TaxID=2020715 RepID=A0A5R9IN07_9GAMM|nr:carbon-nitrogen hydrolase family protein [Thalassotalea litorea]
MSSQPDVDKNLAEIDRILTKHAIKTDKDEAHLVVLPECCLFFGGRDQQQLQLAELLCDMSPGSMQSALAALATKHQCYLLAGSIPTHSVEPGAESGAKAKRFSASSLLFSPSGELIADYQKLHLFDVNVDDNTKSYQESLYTQPGGKVTCVDIDGITIGLAICYDLRFPELFRAMRQQGAQVICLPSAFTQVTGEAHWQPLLQARAIENQVYMVAAAQQGVHANGRETYGHAMVVDPWGDCRVIDSETQLSGLVSIRYDQQLIKRVRASIPVNDHNRFTLHFN